jgi:hypothetical protein
LNSDNYYAALNDEFPALPPIPKLRESGDDQKFPFGTEDRRQSVVDERILYAVPIGDLEKPNEEEDQGLGGMSDIEDWSEYEAPKESGDESGSPEKRPVNLKAQKKR